jgi:hypothetical protein
LIAQKGSSKVKFLFDQIQNVCRRPRLISQSAASFSAPVVEQSGIIAIAELREMPAKQWTTGLPSGPGMAALAIVAKIDTPFRRVLRLQC